MSNRLDSGGASSSYKQLDWPGLFGGNIFFGFSSLMKTLNGYLRTFMVFASKVWTFMCFVFRKQTRSVSITLGWFSSISRTLLWGGGIEILF